MKQDPKRATGRTLGLALQSIGKAVENPGTEVEFINHNPQNVGQHLMCKSMIEDIAKQLNLDITVVLRGKTNSDDFKVIVKSNWVSPYAQRTPAEEKWKEIYGSYPDSLGDNVLFHSFKIGFESGQKNV
jgi:hypothetical protein